MPRGTRRSARRSAPAAAKAAEHESADAAQDVPSSDHDDENETAGRANEKVANETTVHQSLAHLLTTLSKPEDLLTTILMPAVAQSDGGGGDEIASLLRSASRTLFGRLEQLAAMEERLRTRQMAQQEEEDGGAGEDEKEGDDDAVEAPLSGLAELYTGEADGSADGGDMAVDAETLWGQVDLQNEALLPKLRKSVRSLAKAIDREGPASVKLLDFGDLTDHDNDDDDSGNDDDESRSGSEQGGDDVDVDASDEEEEDDEARRIRERMEKAMAEMSDEDLSHSENDDEESDGPTATKRAEKISSSHVAQSKGSDDEEEDLEDPAADELNDGFFDINEMEAFADEEEDYLPEDMDAVVEEERRKQKNAKKAKLPHQRQRQGAESDDSEDEDDDDREEPSHAKRKKYRDDDEIDALYNLYQEAHSDGESDDEEEDVADMTAADFFGLPNKRYLRAKKGQDVGKAKSLAKDKSSKGGEDSKKKKVSHEEEDVDSWDEHSFGDEEHDDDDGPGWRDEHPEGPDKARGKDSDDDNDDNSGESSSDEEEEGSNDEQMEVEEEEKEPERQTTHAISSTTLLKQTEELEKEALAEKPWQMTGESKGTQRPTNSLLEATPEFEVANKMAPIITVEHTENIEEMIKKRVIDEDWDDVVPRELPDIGLGKRKGELPEVSQEKSKLGLGELYEREYLKKVAGYDKDAVERETEEDKVKNEMKALFANLCSQLDALSNYHFAPRPVADEAEIRTVATPAIAMEEALPLHVSDARGVAPEEVYAAKQGRGSVIRGESEMDQTERKRLRNAKKAARRKARKAKLADEKLISRLQPGLGLNNPYEKRKLREELQMARASGKVTEGEIDANKDYATSTKFFQRMQENVAMEVHGDGASEGRKRKRDDQSAQHKSSAYKL